MTPGAGSSILCAASPPGEAEPEDLVAWTMIEYNSYFGERLVEAADAAAGPAGLLRVQALLPLSRRRCL